MLSNPKVVVESKSVIQSTNSTSHSVTLEYLGNAGDKRGVMLDRTDLWSLAGRWPHNDKIQVLSLLRLTR